MADFESCNGYGILYMRFFVCFSDDTKSYTGEVKDGLCEYVCMSFYYFFFVYFSKTAPWNVIIGGTGAGLFCLMLITLAILIARCIRDQGFCLRYYVETIFLHTSITM